MLAGLDIRELLIYTRMSRKGAGVRINKSVLLLKNTGRSHQGQAEGKGKTEILTVTEKKHMHTMARNSGADTEEVPHEIHLFQC